MLAYSCLVTCVVRKMVYSVFIPLCRNNSRWRRKWRNLDVFHYISLGMNNSKYLKTRAQRRAEKPRSNLRLKKLAWMAEKCEQNKCLLLEGEWLRWVFLQSVIADIKVELMHPYCIRIFSCTNFLLMRPNLHIPFDCCCYIITSICLLSNQ